MATQIESHELFERHAKIFETARMFGNDAAQNVVVVISTLPKRFFFPIVKALLQSPRIKNLLAIYTTPPDNSKYPLAEDAEPWRHLPVFMPPVSEPKEKILIVGLGYEPFGLPELVWQEMIFSICHQDSISFPPPLLLGFNETGALTASPYSASKPRI